ncbi:hypothetical protein EWM64_g10443 [Hericium alpestre]|uniref:Proteasome endopeptidase complex n=1 Tax=Hericium alpestre TaxID=135208 RepID=A0A4Y9ZHC3_9AGAM|nr:hypothetical protein EWM64_g10443 [Hericium alpestre]
MASTYRGAGFDFGNEIRNSFLQDKGLNLPKATSTGTTIVGCLFKDGIVLGADTRATEGPIVADKNCEKIHYITDNIRCCGAGTAADTEFITALISSNMELHALNTGRKPRVVTAMTMLKQRLFRADRRRARSGGTGTGYKAAPEAQLRPSQGRHERHRERAMRTRESEISP